MHTRMKHTHPHTELMVLDDEQARHMSQVAVMEGAGGVVMKPRMRPPPTMAHCAVYEAPGMIRKLALGKAHVSAACLVGRGARPRKVSCVVPIKHGVGVLAQISRFSLRGRHTSKAQRSIT